MKPCTKCQVVKPLTDFFLRSSVTGERMAVCKVCHLAYMKSKRPVTARMGRRLIPADREQEIIDRYLRGEKTQEELGAEFGSGRGAVAYLLKSKGITQRPAVRQMKITSPPIKPHEINLLMNAWASKQIRVSL